MSFVVSIIIIIIGSACSIACCMGVVLAIRRRTSAVRSASPNANGKPDLGQIRTDAAQAAVKQALVPYICSESMPPSEECAICLNTMNDQGNVLLLPCGHFFHQSCVVPWLASATGECVVRMTCPNCKQLVQLPAQDATAGT